MLKTLVTLPLQILLLVSTIYNKGLFYWIGFTLSYVYLGVVDFLTKRRFHLYDLTSRQPRKHGFLTPHHEYKLESPTANKATLNEHADDIFLFGVNAKCEGLAIHISRLPNDRVRCSLVLRLSNGKVYCLPEEHDVQMENGEDFTFGSSRFKVQCVIPMRKWRIFFNGILKEQSTNFEMPSHKHVTFTFIFTSSSDVYDFTKDMSKNSLAHNATSSSSWKALPLFILQRMKNVFNSYEQSGMFSGTVKVEGEEENEVYLWGNRGHHLGKTRNLKEGHFTEVYGLFQNGALLHLGFLSQPQFKSKFQYGYVMQSNGFMYSIDKVPGRAVDMFDEKIIFRFTSAGVNYELNIKKALTRALKFKKELNGSSFAKYADMTLKINDLTMNGKGFLFHGSVKELPRNTQYFSTKYRPTIKKSHLAVPFYEVECQNSELTGGKGSSLGKLYTMSEEMSNTKLNQVSFEVPKGLVVTTEAYKVFTRGALNKTLQKFQELVWSKPLGESKQLCQKIVAEIAKTKLPEKICSAIESNLNEIFLGDYGNKKFAVRSSATGEDTEQMSAAGQMETFLGLTNINQIFDAVKRCWASQFAFQAVEYKRRYGQILNSPMAVVIQEMVACDVAGVAFTCDPVNGNPSYINITANWGLGESVVSGSSEPDTLVLKRDLHNRVEFLNHQIGKKQTKIIMDGESGTREIEIEDDSSSNCCLSNEMAIRLGQIAVKIEDHYGSARDLEWGIIDKKIFLFQSRPITSLDTDTDFEAKHFFDTYMRIENEYFSKANVGEVMPGATSPLGMDYMMKNLDRAYEYQHFVRYEGGDLPKVPYFYKRIISKNNHIFFNLIDGFMKFEDEDDTHTKGLMMALFGREIQSKELIQLARERHRMYGKNTIPAWRYTVFGYVLKYFSGLLAMKTARKLASLKLSCKHQYSSDKMLNYIAHNCYISVETMRNHMYTSISSSSLNMEIILFLATANKSWNSDVYSDFGYLLSTCTEIESADVPAAIQTLAYAISKSPEAAKFKKMKQDDATNWLQNSSSEAGIQFRNFLLKHGHRCLREFDMKSDPWGYEPRPLVKMIQTLITPDMTESAKKETPSFSTILSKMHIKLDFNQKLKLRWLLPDCRRGVRNREYTKSVAIKSFDAVRKLFRPLSETLVKEGRLPNRELMYFLCIDEIDQLIQTRSPRIVARALKRLKVQKELNDMQFPEIFSGIPKLENLNGDLPDNASGSTMTGIPVSQGVIKATARIVMHLDDAVNIKAGDILITYATDIGWTPYFPLLSGVVTELGGLISHGAVVAREFGLPCVVGLHGATKVFKSGDIVILDGNKGTLTKVNN